MIRSVEESLHRALFAGNDHVHVRVSNEFRSYAKYAIAALYLMVLIALRRPTRSVHLSQPAIALCGATGMVLMRSLLPHCPPLNLRRAVIVEPMVVLFGNLLVATCLHKEGVWVRVRTFLDHPVKYVKLLKIMATSFACSALFMDIAAVTFLSMVVVDLGEVHSIPFLLALTSGATLGSALTKTGSVHTMILTTLSYDTIGWKDYSRDVYLPVLASIGVHVCILAIIYHAKLSSAATTRAYSELSTVEHQDEDDVETTTEKDDVEVEVTNQNVHTKDAPVSLESAQEEEPEEEPIWFHFLKFTCGVGVYLSICSYIAGWQFYAMLSALLALLAFAVITKIKRSVAGTISVTCMAYFLCLMGGVNAQLVSVTVGAILLVVTSFRNCSGADTEDESQGVDDIETIGEVSRGGESPEDALSKLDYGPYVFITSMLILTASLTDTGLPQQCVAHVLGEDCGNNGFSEASNYWCTFKFSAIIGLLSSLVSSIPTALILTATFPYASPYVWMQLSFINSISGSLSWSYGSVNGIVASKTKDFCWKHQLIFTLPSVLYSICIGSWILGQVHVAHQCSERLGECEEVYSLGRNHHHY